MVAGTGVTLRSLVCVTGPLFDFLAIKHDHMQLTFRLTVA